MKCRLQMLLQVKLQRGPLLLVALLMMKRFHPTTLFSKPLIPTSHASCAQILKSHLHHYSHYSASDLKFIPCGALYNTWMPPCHLILASYMVYEVECSDHLKQKLAESMIAHKEEIFSHPKRIWFVAETEKKVAAKAAKAKLWNMRQAGMIPQSASSWLGSYEDGVEYYVCLNGHMLGTCTLLPLSDSEDVSASEEE
ncbi:hypothetical protein Ahy_A06g028151 [Arachis hypogaea]|uniref:Uncharacterized protein n=1 Tax=Arachis hypogaea TaxID=3818 RepID=A0A445CQI0_ARAHY|nr:hypothetical protein Ahy_A06g028151 [Arachis hypogaea]